MKILLVAVGIVIAIWIINLLLQRREREVRETQIKKRLEEKKKQEEKSQIPFKRKNSP